MLRRLLGRLDVVHPAVFSGGEVAAWPRGALDRLVTLGILREIDLARSIRYDGCDEGCIVAPEVVENPRTGQLEGVFCCNKPGCGGRVPVELDLLRRWQFDVGAFAAILAGQLGIAGEPQVVAAGRVILLGTLTTGTGPLEIFLVIGVNYRDATTVLQSCERLRAAHDPVVLMPCRMPQAESWPMRCAAVLSVAEHVQWPAADGDLDFSSLVALVHSVRPATVEEGWLTVTEAAKLLLTDVSGLEIEAAKARVSKAANDQRFRTNGKRGHERRIEAISFSAWRLQQRERDVAAADAWADEDE